MGGCTAAAVWEAFLACLVPAMALAVSFDTFCEWVDDALQEGVELLTDADAESADSTAEKGKESDME